MKFKLDNGDIKNNLNFQFMVTCIGTNKNELENLNILSCYGIININNECIGYLIISTSYEITILLDKEYSNSTYINKVLKIFLRKYYLDITTFKVCQVRHSVEVLKSLNFTKTNIIKDNQQIWEFSR